MSPVSIQVGLLALAVGALAQPYHGHAHKHGRFHHESSSSAAAPYGYGNGTAAGPTAGPTGTGGVSNTLTSTTTCFSTVTVSPIAASSSAPDTSAAPTTNLGAGAGGISGSASATCGGTVYETFTNTVTVTATVPAGTAPASVPSGGTAFYPGTTSSSSFVSYSAPVVPSSSSSEAAPVSSSAAPSLSSYSAPASSAPASSSEAPASSSSSPATISFSIPAESPTAYSSASSATPSASSSSSSAAPSSTGTGKRGCIYASDASHCNALDSDQVTWANNWVGAPGSGLPSSMTYVPQLHSTDSMFTDGWETAATSGASVLAAFNEPDHTVAEGGSELTPAAAYSNWDLMTKYQSGSVKITSPAVSSTDAPDFGLDWLKQFTQLGASWDITNIHFYGDCTSDQTAGAFQSWVQSVRSEYSSLPIYVSEYGCNPGASDDQISSFIQSTASWMDSQDYVERYAFFRADVGSGWLLSGDSTLSPAGTTYTTCT